MADEPVKALHAPTPADRGQASLRVSLLASPATALGEGFDAAP